jgi:hypothetical protein
MNPSDDLVLHEAVGFVQDIFLLILLSSYLKCQKVLLLREDIYKNAWSYFNLLVIFICGIHYA